MQDFVLAGFSQGNVEKHRSKFYSSTMFGRANETANFLIRALGVPQEKSCSDHSQICLFREKTPSLKDQRYMGVSTVSNAPN